MKKEFFRVLTVIMVLFILSSSMFASAAAPRQFLDTYVVEYTKVADNRVADLLAGQNTDVGDVYINQLGDKEYLVTYKVALNGWYITEIHFEGISLGEDPFIYSNGGLVPGKFTVNESFSLESKVTTYSFIYTATAAVVNFAAHAVVELPSVLEICNDAAIYVSDTRTEYLNAATGWQPAVDAWVHSEWINPAYFNIGYVTGYGARWIWNSYRVNQPVNGEIVEFRRQFNLEECTVTSASLMITTDNGYEVKINGNFVGSAQLSGDWRTSLLTNSFVNPSEWQTVETYDVTDKIIIGGNLLEITGVNEYMGPLDNQADGTIDTNPGGILYKLIIFIEKRHEVPGESETAWGTSGTDASGSNWSQLIPEALVQ